MSLVVFTAVIGTTDTLRAPFAVDPSAHYLCFSDRRIAVPPYEWVPVPSTDRAMLAARRIKILADHPLLQAADVTLWHDASYCLRRTFGWLDKALAQADLAALRHPRRTAIEDEALAIARYGYLTSDAALAHVARYRAAGFADRVLTASGLLGRRTSAEVSAFNAIWWDEVQHWNGRDQGSLNYAAWCAGVRVRHVAGSIRDNRLAVWRLAS